jgi:hypothetical protein
MKNIAVLLIISVFWISYRTTQYFEDKLNSNQTKVLGATQEKRFFLPLPKHYEEISREDNVRNTSLIIKTNKPITELRDFYKEILRSKNYQNDYEYEKDNLIEISYLNDKEEIKITLTQEGDESLIQFNHHY